MNGGLLFEKCVHNVCLSVLRRHTYYIDFLADNNNIIYIDNNALRVVSVYVRQIISLMGL